MTSGIWLIWRPGFGILEERESKVRDCNYERDTRLSGFTMQDSGNVVVKNRYPVTKTEKSFHFYNTSCPHFSSTLSRSCFNRTTFLIPPSSTGSPKMRESGTSVRHFLERMFGIGINRQEPSGLRDWGKILVGMTRMKNPIGDPP